MSKQEFEIANLLFCAFYLISTDGLFGSPVEKMRPQVASVSKHQEHPSPTPKVDHEACYKNKPGVKRLQQVCVSFIIMWSA